MISLYGYCSLLLHCAAHLAVLFLLWKLYAILRCKGLFVLFVVGILDLIFTYASVAVLLLDEITLPQGTYINYGTFIRVFDFDMITVDYWRPISLGLYFIGILWCIMELRKNKSAKPDAAPQEIS